MELARIIGVLFPGLRASWLKKRAQLEHAERFYDAAKTTNYRPKRGANASGDAVMQQAGPRIRQLARYLDENLDLAIGVLDELVGNIVGVGITVEPMVKTRAGQLDAGTNQQIRDLWDEWTRRPEVTGELSFSEAERMICRSWLRDGETLVQHVTGTRFAHASRVPYSIELLEADFLPFELNDITARIIHGVEKNDWNQPVAYHLFKKHPGHSNTTATILTRDTKRVPAEQVAHVKFTRRIAQTRGVSILHGVLTRLDDVRDYEESERIAARVAAAMTGFIQRASDAYSGDSNAADPVTQMESGMIFQLGPGETVGTIGHDRPNTGLADFRAAMLRAVAAGTGTRFSAIARDFNGTYSAQRQELVEARPQYVRLLKYLVGVFYRPVYSRFIETAVLAGVLRPARGVDMATIAAADFRGPALPWIDPKKEIEAEALAVENGFKSRRQVIRDHGGNPDEVDAQLADDGDRQPTQPASDPAPAEDIPGDQAQAAANG